MQSKKESIMEALLNQFIGFLLAVGMYHFIVPLITEIKTTPQDSVAVVLMFTALSICRGYVIRRFFNKRIKDRL